MKLGLFGGTFDPIHLGHRYLAEKAAEAAGLDKLIVIPAKIPPHKIASGLVSEQDRLEMCRLAFADLDCVEVSDFEMKNEGKSYSYNTVLHFRELYPDCELYFIMGSDQLLTFEKWYRYEDILHMAGIIALSRGEEDSVAELEAKAASLGAEDGRVIVVKTEPFEISSTAIRDAFANGSDPSCYLDKNVVEYIVSRGLYAPAREEAVSFKKKYSAYRELIKSCLSKKRAQHSVNVANAAVRLAERYGEDPEKAYVAGLLHDVCKELPPERQKELVLRCRLDISEVEKNAQPLFHAPAGAVYIEEELGIKDEDVIAAVRYHTVGCGDMSKLAQIIYLADLISADRDYKDVRKMRRYAVQSLEKAMLEALKFSLSDSVGKENSIPVCTLECYNRFVMLSKMKED